MWKVCQVAPNFPTYIASQQYTDIVLPSFSRRGWVVEQIGWANLMEK